MMTYDPDYRLLWERLFKERPWGRYPPEDLVRFVARRFGGRDRGEINILEVGCGPGANVWFLHREGYRVSAIDFSPTALEQAKARIEVENANLRTQPVDFQRADIAALLFPDDSFDLVVDVFALCCNPSATIRAASAEIRRVLKPGGALYTKTFGPKTTGADGPGERMADGTYTKVENGPLAPLGVVRFSDETDLRDLHAGFASARFDNILRTDVHTGYLVDETIGIFEAAA
jgi:SAM-dependent methyltransferase